MLDLPLVHWPVPGSHLQWGLRADRYEHGFSMTSGEQSEVAETVSLECPSRRVKWVFTTFGIELR
jgi:hypothetical protein